MCQISFKCVDKANEQIAEAVALIQEEKTKARMMSVENILKQFCEEKATDRFRNSITDLVVNDLLGAARQFIPRTCRIRMPDLRNVILDYVRGQYNTQIVDPLCGGPNLGFDCGVPSAVQCWTDLVPWAVSLCRDDFRNADIFVIGNIEPDPEKPKIDFIKPSSQKQNDIFCQGGNISIRPMTPEELGFPEGTGPLPCEGGFIMELVVGGVTIAETSFRYQNAAEANKQIKENAKKFADQAKDLIISTLGGVWEAIDVAIKNKQKFIKNLQTATTFDVSSAVIPPLRDYLNRLGQPGCSGANLGQNDPACQELLTKMANLEPNNRPYGRHFFDVCNATMIGDDVIDGPIPGNWKANFAAWKALALNSTKAIGGPQCGSAEVIDIRLRETEPGESADCPAGGVRVDIIYRFNVVEGWLPNRQGRAGARTCGQTQKNLKDIVDMLNRTRSPCGRSIFHDAVRGLFPGENVDITYIGQDQTNCLYSAPGPGVANPGNNPPKPPGKNPTPPTWDDPDWRGGNFAGNELPDDCRHYPSLPTSDEMSALALKLMITKRLANRMVINSWTNNVGEVTAAVNAIFEKGCD